jgi:hypothetical protein
LIPYFKGMTLKEIDPFTIDSFYEEKRDEGLEGSYIKIMHHLLNRSFKKAVQWRLIRTNPVNDATPQELKEKRRRHRGQKMSLSDS